MPAISAALSAMAFSSVAGGLSCSRSARSTRLLCSIRSASSTTRDGPPRCARYRSGPRWTPGVAAQFVSAIDLAALDSLLPLRGQAPVVGSARARPARSSAVLAAVSHAFRVFSSHSLFMKDRVFSAPPFSGAALLARLNHCSASLVVTIEATFGDHQVRRGDSPRRRDGSPACRAIAPPR